MSENEKKGKSGKLSRLRITAYKTSRFKKKVGEDDFYVQANPTNYSVAYSVQFNNRRRQKKGSSSFDPGWSKNPPRKLSLEFIFDATGAIPALFNKDGSAKDDPKSKTPLETRIKAFESIVFRMKSKTHRPNYLILNWGALVFKCLLQSMTINYKMFKPNGDPLRATVNASFTEVKWDVLREKEEDKQSPDITHVKTVRDGDRITQLADEIYGDNKYYMAIAKANNIIQFRNLKAGKAIFFPPIAKK